MTEKQFKIYTKVGIIAFIICSVFFAFQVNKVGFDYDFEKFFPDDDIETEYFLKHREKFKSDNDFLLIAIENEKGIFDSTFLNKINLFTKILDSSVPHVKQVQSITNSKEIFIHPGSSRPKSIPYINLNKSSFKKDSIRIFKSKELINTFVAEDAKSTCIFLKHDDFLSKEKSDELVSSINESYKEFNFDKVRVAGRTIGQQYYLNMMYYELLFSIVLSAVLVIIFLFIAFRSGWGIIVPKIIIVATLLWLIGSLGLLDVPINVLLTTIPLIMFIVAMSDVIHLVSRYLDAIRVGASKYEAIKITVKEVGIATLLTSVTTAIGFFSLYFVKVQPIQVFGLVIGAGVLLAFVLSILILPILFYFFPTPKYVERKNTGEFWKKKLAKWFILVLKAPKKTITITLIIIGTCVIGISFIETNNYMMDDLDDSVSIKQDFNYLDDHYGGIRPLEIVVELKDSNDQWFDINVLNDINKIEDYLSNEYGATIKLSICQITKVLNRASHSGNPEYFKIPQSKREIKKIKRALKMAGRGDFIYSIMDSSEKILRINGNIPDAGNMNISKRNAEFNKFIKKENLQSKYNIIVTGTAHLLDKNMKYLSTSLIIGLCISIGIVSLIMGVIFKSFKMVVISIIPNLIPLIIIGGMMGYMGVDLKISTAIIFTIAFGIAVDDTIHFLGKFKIELLKGRSKLYALKRAYITTGKAMIITTLVLCSGFLLLLFSNFTGTAYLGGLLSITLFAALILDLTILPVLILLFFPEQNKK